MGLADSYLAYRNRVDRTTYRQTSDPANLEMNRASLEASEHRARFEMAQMPHFPTKKIPQIPQYPAKNSADFQTDTRDRSRRITHTENSHITGGGTANHATYRFHRDRALQAKFRSHFTIWRSGVGFRVDPPYLFTSNLETHARENHHQSQSRAPIESKRTRNKTSQYPIDQN